MNKPLISPEEKEQAKNVILRIINSEGAFPQYYLEDVFLTIAIEHFYPKYNLETSEDFSKCEEVLVELVKELHHDESIVEVKPKGIYPWDNLYRLTFKGMFKVFSEIQRNPKDKLAKKCFVFLYEGHYNHYLLHYAGEKEIRNFVFANYDDPSNPRSQEVLCELEDRLSNDN